MSNDDGMTITTSGGNCPVQIEGTIDGRPFYFRARGEHWSLEIHPTATGHYLSWPDDRAQWTIEQEWGDGPFDAGWMSIDTAMDIIKAGCALWRATRAPYKCDSLNVSPERLQELRTLFGVPDEPRGLSASEAPCAAAVTPESNALPKSPPRGEA